MKLSNIIKSLSASISSFFDKDLYVSKKRRDEETVSRRGIALLTAFGFFAMSILNLVEHSYVMLASTLISSISFMIGWYLSKYKNKQNPLLIINVITFIFVFTLYTISGANNGFAALWIVLATYVVMLAVNFKIGFCISLYYFVMLVLVFDGPLKYLLMYDYDKTFLLRYPMLYLINMALAVYLSVRYRLMEYEYIIQHEKLDFISKTDLCTGLLNRNSFQTYQQNESSINSSSISIIYIDVNGLHELNNTKGHDAGDKMLKEIADLCKEHFIGALVFRLGGDEFLIIQEDISEKETVNKMEALKNAVKEKSYMISTGLSYKENGPYDLTKMIKDADAKMLEDKAQYYRTHERRRQR